MSYNILDGGEGRADPLAEVIEAQRPDVVALVEADNAAVVERIAGRMKMEFILAQGRRHGAAILSRGSILESVNHSLLRDEFSDLALEATVAGPGGAQWTLAAVHLHPRARLDDEARREREIEGILEIFSRHRKENRPHLLAGDFNSNSPIQKVDARKNARRGRGRIWRRTAGCCRAVRFRNFWMRDTWIRCRRDWGRRPGRSGVLPRNIRVSGWITFLLHGIEGGDVKEAKVEQDRLAKYASDHFPVVVEID